MKSSLLLHLSNKENQHFSFQFYFLPVAFLFVHFISFLADILLVFIVVESHDFCTSFHFAHV